MPRPPVFRRKPSAHGPSTLFRYLCPHTHQRARTRLFELRHETLPALRHRTQSRIYRYILARKALKLNKGPGVLQRLHRHSRKLLGPTQLEDHAERRAMSYQDSYAPREPGARRRKLAGYLKAANELRQTYQQQYAPAWNRGPSSYEYEDDTPGGFPDAAIVRSGEEEMILFPSYARKHVKRKPETEPGTVQDNSGDGRDVRDSGGAGDAEFWKQQWDDYEDDNATVDVDVRGWIYSPHKGQMSRKQRLFIGLARQLVGIQAPPAGAPAKTPSTESSREPSPGQSGHRERAQERQAQRDEMLTAKEAEEILRKGEKEADAAAKGAYSEKPVVGNDDTKLYRTESQDTLRSQDSRGNLRTHQLSHTPSNSSLRSEENIAPIQKRASWNQPADMNAAELAEANARLMARLRHFLAIPMANTPISIFFYNNQVSKQRTIYTDPSGHFSISAALDFTPTHVRILASDKLSATEDIIVTESKGVSVISDIDDTIKHSAISSGAREIFRNAFIRELGDLTIDGVKEWYTEMAEMGVKFHYVSNSPWQLYPVISRYFTMAGLPPGSFHLKQYSGMLQGIFEPVAERKKTTLDKIARDFPERRFMLVGDSGEADLEVYTDFVTENPGRVIAVFIRDVTTTEESGFFDPSMGPLPGDRSSSVSQQSYSGMQHRAQRPPSEETDPELRAAIARSLRDYEEDNARRSSSSIFPQIDQDHPNLRPSLPERRTQPAPPEPVANLIDLSSDDEPVSTPALRRVNTDTETASLTSTTNTKAAPPPPKKPAALRSSSGDSQSSTLPSPTSTSKSAPPPPKPRKPSNLHQSSPLTQPPSNTSSIHNTDNPQRTPTSKPPPIAPKPDMQAQQQSYAGMARDKLNSVYHNFPSWQNYSSTSTLNYASEQSNTTSAARKGSAPPPPPPPRRGVNAAASYVGSKASSAWQHAPNMPHPSIPYHSKPNSSVTAASQSQYPFSTSSASLQQNSYGSNNSNNRMNTSTPNNALGMNGGASNGYGGGEAGGQVINKREQLWKQRWARAEQVLGEKGVVLRSWRVGSDVAKEAARLVRKVEREVEKEKEKEKR